MVGRTTIRVAIAEDQPLFRQMLASALAATPQIAVVSVSPDVATARQAIDPAMTDVALLDIQLGDGSGIDLGVALRESNPAIGILLLSATDAMDVLLDLPRPVSRGWSYLSKNSSLSLPTLVRAIEFTAEGRTVLDPELVAARSPRRGTSLSLLSPRQYDVLRLLAQGLSNAGIANRLGLAPRSVDNHINGIYAALGLSSGGTVNPRVGAALQFIEQSTSA